jgi:hypothetical protein
VGDLGPAATGVNIPSAQRLAKVLGGVSLTQKHLQKLPKTRRRLARAVESWVDFALRRIHLAALRLRAKGVPCARWRVKQMAGLRPELIANAAIDGELARLATTHLRMRQTTAPHVLLVAA